MLGQVFSLFLDKGLVKFWQWCSLVFSTGSFKFVLKIEANVALVLAIVPPVIYIILCYYLGHAKSNLQITIAAIMSIIYAFLMTAAILSIAGNSHPYFYFIPAMPQHIILINNKKNHFNCYIFAYALWVLYIVLVYILGLVDWESCAWWQFRLCIGAHFWGWWNSIHTRVCLTFWDDILQDVYKTENKSVCRLESMPEYKLQSEPSPRGHPSSCQDLKARGSSCNWACSWVTS